MHSSRSIKSKPSKHSSNSADGSSGLIIERSHFVHSQFAEERSIMLTMASPIILTAWFSNFITGLPFTNPFGQHRKSKIKRKRLSDAIRCLIDCDLLLEGFDANRHVISARKQTYLKKTPAAIRANPQLLGALESFCIDIDQYENCYISSPLPKNLELTETAIETILCNDDYVEVAHLFNNAKVEQEMQQRVLSGSLGQRFVHGYNQYFILSSTQRTGNKRDSSPYEQSHYQLILPNE